MKLIESDSFPIEFVSRVAERESWRKEIHRPVYHVHKWWAKRLGTVFRAILLGSVLDDGRDLAVEFYSAHCASRTSVLDPFMGSGTTIGEAHKLGMTALGKDINPVAVRAVRTALGELDPDALSWAFRLLEQEVGGRVHALYRSRDRQGRPCTVLYYFWAMQAPCVSCGASVNLLSSWIVARNAAPGRRSQVQLLCPGCGHIFSGDAAATTAACPACCRAFDPHRGPAAGADATCPRCTAAFSILGAIAETGRRPLYRLYGKLVLAQDGRKEYVAADAQDVAAYERCSALLADEVACGRIALPNLALEDGRNTRQAMSYNFKTWRDFFNDRQLLALGWLHRAIGGIEEPSVREPLLTLFSGTLEFNNLFASYKGEGTGAVRHMFSHHILKPERAPIEAHVWGTPRSSGSFSGLFRGRLMRAAEYRRRPEEVGAEPGSPVSPPFSGRVEPEWPSALPLGDRAIYLSCGDSSATQLPHGCVDLVVTDPPFFDNVNYSELADFFYAWQQLGSDGARCTSTRHEGEVQDSDAGRFAAKLRAVFAEAHRVLKDDGLLVFTYHHSREEGWAALRKALSGAHFTVVNSHPVRAEMIVAAPKSQAREPIQLDVIIVCRKQGSRHAGHPPTVTEARAAAERKASVLQKAGFSLSRSDERVILNGQLLTVDAEAAGTDGWTACSKLS